MPVHNHPVSDPGHGHQSDPDTAGRMASTLGLPAQGLNQTTYSYDFHALAGGTGIWINNTGGSQPYDPTSIGVYVLIRAT
jgi:hypothetical protein